MKLKKYLKAILIFLLPIFLLNFLVFALAWTGPTQAPPGGNVPTFLNSSDQGQFKIGALGVGGLFEAKTIRINPTDAVMVDCQESFRGLLWFNRDDVEGDDISICRKDEGVATYSWQELGGGVPLLEQATPSAPTMLDHYIDSITLDTLTCPGNNPQYKVEGGDWQESNIFIGLDLNTTYTFYQRCAPGIDFESEPWSYYDFSVSSSANLSTVSIGDPFGGGVLAYHDGSGGGLIAATSDQSTGAEWGCYGTLLSGTSTAYGTGLANTDRIMSQCATRPIAASVARAHTGGGYNDWFLPSKDELNQLYVNRAAIGGFNTTGVWYWSSSESNSDRSWVQRFSDGAQGGYHKNTTNHVRAVRAF